MNLSSNTSELEFEKQKSAILQGLAENLARQNFYLSQAIQYFDEEGQSKINDLKDQQVMLAQELEQLRRNRPTFSRPRSPVPPVGRDLLSQLQRTVSGARRSNTLNQEIQADQQVIALKAENLSLKTRLLELQRQLISASQLNQSKVNGDDEFAEVIRSHRAVVEDKDKLIQENAELKTQNQLLNQQALEAAAHFFQESAAKGLPNQQKIIELQQQIEALQGENERISANYQQLQSFSDMQGQGLLQLRQKYEEAIQNLPSEDAVYTNGRFVQVLAEKDDIVQVLKEQVEALKAQVQ